MNANDRFSDGEAGAQERGMDGLLDEIARNGLEDDPVFLSELEQRFDQVDSASTAVQHASGWRLGWPMVKLVAAVTVFSGASYLAYEQWGAGESIATTATTWGGESSTMALSEQNDLRATDFFEPSAPPGEAESGADGMSDVAVLGESTDFFVAPSPLPPETESVLPVTASSSSGVAQEISFREASVDFSAIPSAGGKLVPEDGAIYDGFGKDGWGESSALLDEGLDNAIAGTVADVSRNDGLDLAEFSIGERKVNADFAETGLRGLSLADASLKKDRLGDIAPGLRRLATSSTTRVRYPALIDNAFRSPTQDPLSTFSIDVDTASYSNVRRMIQAGEAVPKDAVRIEELINYFDYSYAKPGDELPFSVNLESAACPWKPEHRLVRVGLKGKEIKAEKRQALNLVFLVDVSGSMNQERKLPLVQRSLHLLIDQLREDDSITIVTYAGSEGVALEPTRGSNKAAMHRAVDGLRSSGGTNGEAGIRLAYRLAAANYSDGGVNRILLATDGDFNVGLSSTEALRDMVNQEAKRGVFLSVLGFGSDNLNDAMLETITNDGNGTYHYIDSVSEGRKVLVEDLTSTMITIAKDVKIQVEFNPATVGAYRLVGYANRMLPPEAFNDDRIDAGDIGAGHTVTAFYEIIPPGLANEAVDKLKYQTPKSEPPVSEATDRDDRDVASSNELLTVKLRYKAPKDDVSQLIEVPFTDNGRSFANASADFRFGTSVAAFGMLLRDSDYKGTLTRSQIRAAAAAAVSEDPRRKEFVELIDNAVLPGGS